MHVQVIVVTYLERGEICAHCVTLGVLHTGTEDMLTTSHRSLTAKVFVYQGQVPV